MNSYYVTTDGGQINAEALAGLHIEVLGQTAAATYEILMPNDGLALLKSNPTVKSVIPVVRPAEQFDPEIFPHDPRFKWNLDNFGPLELPKRGWTVPLNDSTLALYRCAIELYEHNTVEKTGYTILVNGIAASAYTFKMNYYWMMGDNRHNSLDSRFWGYVPEDHIIGKAIFTFFRTDATQGLLHEVRWNRVLKPIN